MTKKKTPAKNGAADAANGAAQDAAQTSAQTSAAPEAPQLDPEMLKKMVALRSALRENFGKAVMALMMTPRYRTQMLGDLQHLVLDPMMKDRLALAYPAKTEKTPEPDMIGFAIWASVSEEVDQRIREQIKNGVFPVRLKSEDWASGEINWLLDVVAPNADAITRVIANFRQVVKGGGLHLHPLISRLVDPETLKKMGAQKAGAEGAGVAPADSAETADA